MKSFIWSLKKHMKFFNVLLIHLFLLGVFIGCSGSVEDKNMGLSKDEKVDLGRASAEDNNIEVTAMSFDSQQVNRESEDKNSNIMSKFYSVKVCLNDRKLVKGFGNRTVWVDGKAQVTDSAGCIRISHDIPYDYSDNNVCKAYKRELKLAKNRKRTLSYSINFHEDRIYNHDHSRSCGASTVKAKKSIAQDEIFLKDVFLTYGKNLSRIRSDVRFIKHETKVQSCLDITKTSEPLANTRIKVMATNKETGEISTADYASLRTDNKGCFTTDFISSYEQFRNSHWMEVDLKIIVMSGQLRGKSTHRSVYINPWEPSRLVYGIGEIGRRPNEIPFKSKYAKFHMDGVMYIQIGNDTKNMQINDYLGLTISKSYQVVLNPYVDREHRYTPGAKPIEKLFPEGKFKLSMVLLAPKEGDMEINKHNFEDFEFITGAQKIVSLKNGIINELMNIPFKMTDLPRLAVRTMSIFKVEPLEDIGLESTVVTGFFKARIAWIKTNVLQSTDLNIPNYVDKTWRSIYEGASKKDISAEEMSSNCSISKELSKDTCLKGITEIINSDVDAKTIAYREYVDRMFNKLTLQKSDLYSKVGAKQSIPAKTIYTNYLKKNYKNLEIYNIRELKRKKGISITSADFDQLFPENKTDQVLTRSMLTQLCKELKKKKSYASRFGHAGMGLNRDYNACLKSPHEFFALKGTRHVKKVNKIGESYSNGFSIDFGERYGVSSGESDSFDESSSTFVAADAGLKIPLPLVGDFLGLGVKVGKNWQTRVGHSIHDGYSYTENISTHKNLGVEKFIVDIDINVERCILIQSLPRLNKIRREADDDHYLTAEDAKTTTLVCDPKVVSETYTESWYFVQSRIESSIARDYDGVKERKLLKVLRGSTNFKELRKALRKISENSLVVDNIGHMTPEDELVRNWGFLLGDNLSDDEAAKFLTENVEGSFPGTIEGDGSSPAFLY